MKKNVRLMLKVAIISILFIFVVAVRSFAAEGVDLNNIDFTNIPNGTDTSTQDDAAAKKKAEEEAAAKKKAEEEAAKKKTTTTNTTKTTSTSSSSNTKMPATGSNFEIIFGAAILVVVSGAIVFYRKQSIKLK